MNAFQQLLGSRKIILLIAIVLSVGLYTYVIDNFDPEGNILRLLTRTQPEYTFFSGQPNGLYHDIGSQLAANSADIGILLKNEETMGGFENAINVLNREKAFGLVQESVLPVISAGDILSKHIQVVTPLYTERLHIVYRDARSGEPLTLRSEADEACKFIETNRFHTGSVGSGTRILSDYLLGSLSLKTQPQSNSKESPFEMFERGELDGFFFIAGAQLPEIAKLLAKPDVKLMGVSPLIVQKLRESFKLNYRLIDLQGKYKDKGNVMTIGTLCYLVCSSDVPKSTQREVIKALDSIKENVPSRSEYIENGELGESQRPLKELKFYAPIQSERRAWFMSLARRLLLFFGSVVVTTFVASEGILRLFSSIKQRHYNSESTRLYSENHISVHWTFAGDEEGGSFGRIRLPGYEEAVVGIKKCSHCLFRLRSLREELRVDYESGGITASHYHELDANIRAFAESVMNDVLRLGKLVKRHLEGKKDIDEISKLEQALEDYQTAGIIGLERNIDLGRQSS